MKRYVICWILKVNNSKQFTVSKTENPEETRESTRGASVTFIFTETLGNEPILGGGGQK